MMTGPLFSCTAAAFASFVLAAAPVTKPPAAPAAPKAGAAIPAKEDAETWATRVQKTYEGVKDLSADFEQVTRFKGAAGFGPKSTGTIEVKKPGKMRWEFATPEKKSLVSNGKTLWMFDGEENQVVVNEFMQETTSVTGLNFLEGLGDLKTSFTVTLAEAPADATVKDAVFLTLTPKDTADVQFTSILLAVDRKTGLATEVFLTDPMGSVTRLTLANVVKNKGLADARFTFEIPAGAEVIKPQLLQ
jgi:outer membrane lipoprotein carrier protein